MECSFLIRCHNNAQVEIRDFDRQFLFHSYLLNLSSNFTKMVALENYNPGLSDFERIISEDYIMNALKPVFH